MSIKNIQKEAIYTFPFCFLLIEFIIGMYLNDVFLSIFSFTDELFAIILLLWTIKYAAFVKKQPFNKEVIVFTGVALFYFLYSLYIRSNVFPAICGDLLIQLKPFIGYFMFGYIFFRLNEGQKTVLKRVCLLLFVITVVIVFVGIVSGRMLSTLYYVYGHSTRYGTSLILIALTYLFCSDFKDKKAVLVFVIILSFSLLSMRAKVYGFYAVTLFLILVLRGDIEIKLSVKNIIILSCLILLAIYVARDKVIYYFMDFNIEDEHSMARPLLYVTAWQLLFDYFPFGSGLASFATHYSGVYYSNIYVDYGLDGVWGLLEKEPAFVTDTQYPSIAQFGVAGLILFIMFWVRIVLKANRLKKNHVDNNKSYLIVVLILIFLAIESVGDAVFTGNRGFYAMILLSLSLNSFKDKDEDEVSFEQINS